MVGRSIYNIMTFLPELKNLLIRETDKEFTDIKTKKTDAENTILRVIVRDKPKAELSLKHLSNILVDITNLYEIIIKLDGLEHDELRIGSIDSGSDKSFDFVGIAEAISKLSSFILECWDRVRFGSIQKTTLSLKTASDGLSLIGQINEQVLPIRLSPTPTKCGVRPFPGVKPVKGRRGCSAGDSEQRAERVEGIEAPIESKGEFVEVRL